MWEAENPNQFLHFFHFIQLSGQVITLSFGVFTPPSPNAVWSHWVSITTNPFHLFKINGCGPSLTPEISLAKSISWEHLEDLVFLSLSIYRWVDVAWTWSFLGGHWIFLPIFSLGLHIRRGCAVEFSLNTVLCIIYIVLCNHRLQQCKQIHTDWP